MKLDHVNIATPDADGAAELLSDLFGLPVVRRTLGPDVLAGHAPQVLVPPHHWQAAVPRGGWTLVSCICAPAFEFAGFELAPAGWEPGKDGMKPDADGVKEYLSKNADSL